MYVNNFTVIYILIKLIITLFSHTTIFTRNTIAHIIQHNYEDLRARRSIIHPWSQLKIHPTNMKYMTSKYKKRKRVKLKNIEKTYRKFVVCQNRNRVVRKINCFHKTRNSSFYAVQPFIRTCCTFKSEPHITSAKYRAPIINTFYIKKKLQKRQYERKD